MVDHIKAFVSYSWRVEDETKIVDELEIQCQKRNIQLVRDRNSVQHGGLIRKFMDQLSGGEHIITVFSDAYFKSKWCMFELLEVWRKGDFKDRTYPIQADDCDLVDRNYRLSLVTHWKKLHEEEKAILDGLDPGVILDEFRYVNLYRDIYQNINELMNFSASRMTTELGQLRARDYGQIFDLINPSSQLKAGNSSANLAQSKKQSSGKSSNFRAEIQKHIAKALSVSGMYFYTHVLWEELNKVLISLQLNEVECKPPLIAGQLVLALQQGGEECPVINKALLNSVVDCLDKESDEEKYEKALPHRKEILDGVGQVLGYLVLSLVDEDDARDVSAWLRDDLSNLYFELHASTPGGVELFIARKQERMADLDLDGHKATGKHLIYIETSPLSWHEKARLDEIQRIIWDSVFKDDRQHPLDGDDIKALKAKLLTLRTIGRGAENHYVAIRFEDDGDDSYRKICEDFLSELKIPMVRFGVKGDKQAFGGIEFDLMSSVEQFLKTINKYT